MLAHHGLGLAGDLFDGNGTPAAALPDAAATATVQGLEFSAGWATLLGLGELLTSGLLILGLLTRVVVLPMIGLAALGLVRGFPVEGLPTNEPAMFLVGAVGLSLLISGAGCLALRRPRPRVVMYEVPVVGEPPAPRRRERQHDTPHVPLGQRISNWFGRIRPRSSFARPKRRWRLWPQRRRHAAW